jgi:hypothetical protein
MSIMNSIFDGTGPELKIRRRRRSVPSSQGGSNSSSSCSYDEDGEGSQASSAKSQMTGVPRLTGVGAGTVGDNSITEVSEEEEDRLTRRCVERAVQMFETLKTSFRQVRNICTLIPCTVPSSEVIFLNMHGSCGYATYKLYSMLQLVMIICDDQASALPGCDLTVSLHLQAEVCC